MNPMHGVCRVDTCHPAFGLVWLLLARFLSRWRLSTCSVRLQRFRSTSVPYGTIYDMAVDTTNRNLVTCGQDKLINVWNMGNGKLVRAYVQGGLVPPACPS